MIDQSVAHKSAREIARACPSLRLDRAAFARRNALLNAELDRLETENPSVFLEFSERMGLPIDRNARQASGTGAGRPTVLAMTGLNSGMLADFGTSVLLRTAFARSSDSCADGAREMDNGTLIGSFLMPVG